MVKVKSFEVNGVSFTLQDLEQSETLMHMEEQVFNQDEYQLNRMVFEEGDVVVDIGANIGSVSILLGKMYPFLKIYAFEPHPTNFRNLVHNVQANGLHTTITPVNLAVHSETRQTLPLTLCPWNTGSTSLFKTNPQDANTESVGTISLDDIIGHFDIEKIKFLKLDCEGSEFDILQSSQKIKTTPVENLSVEIHTFMESRGKNVQELVDLVKTISNNPPLCKIYALG